ncbi:hypothetical protein EMIT019CA3_70143 [Bacillus pseudomycoides]
MIENVLHGNLYSGIATYPNRLFATGFFDNMVLNSIGVLFKTMINDIHYFFVNNCIKFLINC